MLGPAAARVDDRIQESKLQISLCLCVTVVKRFSVRQFRSSAVWQCKHFRNSAILIVVLIASCVAPAFARSWRISNFDSSIVVAKNGSAIVTERISLVFVGQFNGIHRYIPINYPSPQGANYTLFIRVLSVKDSDGNSLKYEKGTRDNNLALTIYIPGALDTTKTVEIAYSVANGTRFFPDHDEFYWNVTGTAWPVPIDRASATVILPPETGGVLRAQGFTGAYGSSAH